MTTASETYSSDNIVFSESDVSEWKHVTVTIDAIEKKINFYEDGIHKSSKDLVNGFLPNINSITIGAQSNVAGTTDEFKGQLDNIMVHDRILEIDEIKMLSESKFSQIQNSNAWVHVGASYNVENSNVSIYKNGAKVKTATGQTIDIPSNANDMKVGLGVKGLIDNFAMFQRELTENEFKLLGNPKRYEDKLYTNKSLINCSFDQVISVSKNLKGQYFMLEFLETNSDEGLNNVSFYENVTDIYSKTSRFIDTSAVIYDIGAVENINKIIIDNAGIKKISFYYLEVMPSGKSFDDVTVAEFKEFGIFAQNFNLHLNENEISENIAVDESGNDIHGIFSAAPVKSTTNHYGGAYNSSVEIGGENNNDIVFGKTALSNVEFSQSYMSSWVNLQNTLSDDMYLFKMDGAFAFKCEKDTNTLAAEFVTYAPPVVTWVGTDTTEAKIVASDAGADDFFGQSVAISGDYAIVGAYAEDTGETNAGAAYIYKRDGTSWVEQMKIQSSDAQANDYFGNSVAISGDYAIVGAYKEDTGGVNTGAAYIFKRTGTSWAQEEKVQASDVDQYDHFGGSVAISGDYAIVGASAEATGGDNAGAAYIFKRDGTSWVEQIKIQSSDVEGDDYFGFSVAISGDYAIVGAYKVGSDAGASYIFKRDGTSWTQEAKIQSSDVESNDYFGVSVAISGGYAIVGAYLEDTGGGDAGAAYIYSSKEEVSTVENVISSDIALATNEWVNIGLHMNKQKGELSFFKKTVAETIATTETSSNIDLNLSESDSDLRCYIDQLDTQSNTVLIDNMRIDLGFFSGTNKFYELTDVNNEISIKKVSQDAWTHVAASYDHSKQQVKMYHDGEQVAEYTNYNIDATTDNDQDVLVGKYGDTVISDGLQISAFDVYNSTMNDDQIQSLYESSVF